MTHSAVVLKMCYLANRAIFLIFLLAPITSIDAAEFFCPSGSVTCLIAVINEANGTPGDHVISLEPGSYTLQTVDNVTFGTAHGLPLISGSIRIQATAEDLPTIIERDTNAPAFRIFQVSAGGEMFIDGVTIRRAGGGLTVSFPAILNHGVTSLQDSIVTDSFGDFGTIVNTGTLRVTRSIISDNGGTHQSGGIVNFGNVLVENSTITRNQSQGAGGILNEGSLVVRNSAIVFNRTDEVQPGGGIQNNGSAEIVNATIAKNEAGGGGGGLWNSGQILIINSTIRENGPFTSFGGGGIENEGGIVRLQNTVIAGNSTRPSSLAGQDCFGTIISLGNNFIGDPSGCNINLQPSDLTGDPGLGPLVEFGEDDSPGKAFYPVSTGSVVINNANPAACPKKDQLGNPRIGTCDIGAVEFQGRMLVSIDVRPRSDANRINPNSSQNINVAVFSVKGFDATTLDPNTLRFGEKGTEAAPIHLARRDVDGDGRQDLVARFQIQELGIQCGDTSATLSGQTSSGLAIVGSSPIRTTGCKEPKDNVASRVH